MFLWVFNFMFFLQWAIPEKIHTPNRWHAGNSRRSGVEGSGNLGGGRGPVVQEIWAWKGGTKTLAICRGGFFLEQPNHKNCEN